MESVPAPGRRAGWPGALPSRPAARASPLAEPERRRGRGRAARRLGAGPAMCPRRTRRRVGRPGQL